LGVQIVQWRWDSPRYGPQKTNYSQIVLLSTTPNNNVTFAVSCHVVTLVYHSESIIKIVFMTIYNYCWFEIVTSKSPLHI